MREKKFRGNQWKENIWWSSWSVLMVLQIILAFFLYNPDGLKALFYLGWILMVVGFIIGGMGVSTLRKMGGVTEGKRSSRFGVGTAVLVEGGVYAVVRHPQYLCWIFFNAAVILIAQNWVVMILGLASIVTIYMQAREDDQSLIKKLGDDYRRYMQKVPRMNLLMGILRLVGRGSKEELKGR